MVRVFGFCPESEQAMTAKSKRTEQQRYSVVWVFSPGTEISAKPTFDSKEEAESWISIALWPKGATNFEIRKLMSGK
jgi:hypothetical protein